MELNNSLDQTAPSQLSNTALSPKSKKIIKVLLVFLVVVVVIFIVAALWPKKFGVSSTNPSVNKVATVSPFFDVKFTKPLDSQSIKVTSSPNVVNSFKINSKEIDIVLKIPMNAGQKYTITITGVKDTSGDSLPTLEYTFIPKGVAPKDIPPDQQKALIQQQAPTKPLLSDINFGGTQSLLQNGVSSSQIYGYEQAIFAFAPNASNVSINTATVVPAPHDPESTSSAFSINFTLNIDSKTYNATLTYSDITVSQLTLFDYSTSAVVFTSQSYDSAQAAASQY